MNLYILSDQVTNVTHAQFRLNEIGHPANWCQLATSEELTALGIIT